MQKLGEDSVPDHLPAAAGVGEVRESETTLCRAFTSLLRLAGLSALPGWSGLLWSGALYCLQTGMTYKLLCESLEKFAQLRDARMPFFGAFSGSNFMAIPNVVQWAALTTCFVWGRKRYDMLLPQVHTLLADINFSERVGKGKPLHRAGEYMWALTSAIVVMYAANIGAGVVSTCREGTIPECVMGLGVATAYGYIYLALQLVAMKFIFAGLMLNSGFVAANKELEAFVTDGCDEGHLRRIGELRKQLSDVFSRLTSGMTAELVFVMAYGILVQIVLILMLVNLSTTDVSVLLLLLMLLSADLVALVGPCETCQLLRHQLCRSRDLLLELEWRQPQLAEPTQWMQKSVARDLEMFGDLSFFALRRSTLLSITSTILTYIIVMAQFQMSEQG